MSVLCLKIRGYLSADIQQDLFETTHARPRGHAAATEVGSVKPAVQHPVRHYPNRPLQPWSRIPCLAIRGGMSREIRWATSRIGSGSTWQNRRSK